MAEPIPVPIEVFWPAFGVIVVAGIAGGIVNCLLSDEGFSLPYFDKNKEGRTAWHAGFLSNIALGIAASFLVWAFGANEISNWLRQIAVCFLAGVSGGNVVLTFLQKQKIELEKTKVDAYNSAFKESLGIPEEEPDGDQNEKE